jgi:hypothetical protein
MKILIISLIILPTFNILAQEENIKIPVFRFHKDEDRAHFRSRLRRESKLYIKDTCYLPREELQKIQEPREEKAQENKKSFVAPFGINLFVEAENSSYKTIENGSLLAWRYSNNSDQQTLGIGMRGINYTYGVDEGRRRFFGTTEGHSFTNYVDAEYTDSNGGQQNIGGLGIDMGGGVDIAAQIREDSNFYWGNNLAYSIRYKDQNISRRNIGSEFTAYGQIGVEAGLMISNDDGDNIRVGAISEYRPLWNEGDGIDSALLYGGIIKGTCIFRNEGLVPMSVTGHLKCFAKDRFGGDAIFDAGINLKFDKNFFCEFNYTNDSDRYFSPDGRETLFITFGYGPGF